MLEQIKYVGLSILLEYNSSRDIDFGCDFIFLDSSDEDDYIDPDPNGHHI